MKFAGLVCVSALAGGCATVSMVPGDTTIVAPATAEQSALRQAAETFVERASADGWIGPEADFASLANVLMNGSNDTVDSSPSASEMTLEKLEAEAREARIALATVTDIAQTVLAVDGDSAARADVVSFERVLVTAQKARRNFIVILTDSGVERAASTDLAIQAFEAEIDRARRTADLLAERYAGRSMAAAT